MPTEKEWTVMFYFASDNPLAPGIVSQLKSIKNAGYHQSVNVLAQFDPQTADTPTHIFDVNLVNKLGNPNKQHEIGFRGNDPYIRNLVLDKLWGDERDSNQTLLKARVAEVLGKHEVKYEAPKPPAYVRAGQGGKGAKGNGKITELSPYDSLGSFLSFCARDYPARHYMLFIVGHGLVVGNDVFLYDANAAEQSLTLKNLARILALFKAKVGGNKLELLGLHSCSMSSVEVAYELQGLANNLLASQGPAFVGSWPYREILIRLFNDQKDREDWSQDAGSVFTTIQKIFKYILYNSYDFQLAGYSFDVSWCGLNRNFAPLTAALDNLSATLVHGMKKGNVLSRQAIMLAHWEAQSFWQETYTDLYDFCSCLKRRAEELKKLSTPENAVLGKISDYCKDVMSLLRRQPDVRGANGTGNGNNGNGHAQPLIIRSEFAGPEYQYCKGLSIYFPWSEPVNRHFWNTEYPSYKFQSTGWHNFLKTYLEETLREPIYVEEPPEKGPSPEQALLEEITCRLFNERGQLSRHRGNTCIDAPDECSQAVQTPDKACSASGISEGYDEEGSDSGVGSSSTHGSVSTLGQGDKAGSGSGLGWVFGGSSTLGPGDKAGSASGLGPGDKAGSASGVGMGCDCASIKNYPSFTRQRNKPGQKANPPISFKDSPLFR